MTDESTYHIEKSGPRAPKKKLRVTFSDNTVFCHSNAAQTFIATLNKIGSQRFQEILDKTNLQLNGRPILTKEIYPDLKDYLKPLDGGWYLNTQSDTDHKKVQLININNSLNLGLTIESGTDFQTINKNERKTTRKKHLIKVEFEDGTLIDDESYKEVFVKTIERIGLDKIANFRIEWKGADLICASNVGGNRCEIARNRWIKIPSTSKEAKSLLDLILIRLKATRALNQKITINFT